MGRPWRAAEAEGFHLGQWTANPTGEEVKAHGHAEAHVMLALCPAYVSEAEGEAARDGVHLIFNPAGVFHRDRFLAPGVFFTVTVAAGCDDVVEAAAAPGRPIRLHRPGSRATAFALMRELAGWDVDSGLRAAALCHELIAGAGPASPDRGRPSWLRRGEELLRDSIADELNVTRLAAACGVHPYHFARAYRAVHGCTPSRHLLTLRIGRAAALLSGTDNPLADVALACGFADQSHLTRRFSHVIGVPPGVYRRMTRTITRVGFRQDPAGRGRSDTASREAVR